MPTTRGRFAATIVRVEAAAIALLLVASLTAVALWREDSSKIDREAHCPETARTTGNATTVSVPATSSTLPPNGPTFLPFAGPPKPFLANRFTSTAGVSVTFFGDPIEAKDVCIGPVASPTTYPSFTGQLAPPTQVRVENWAAHRMPRAAITLPYSDPGNEDAEAHIMVLVYDEAAGAWKSVSEAVLVDKESNRVTVPVQQFSVFTVATEAILEQLDTAAFGLCRAREGLARPMLGSEAIE